MTEPIISLRLLETLTSALYEDPIILFREYVQNSIDAYIAATRDKSKEFDGFSVEIEVDKENSNIVIIDNGYGIQEKDFLTKMQRIGESDKRKEDQIGFRGIGRLSAMPLCKELIFENKPQGINKRLIFKWDGNKFNELLNKGEDINASLGEITHNSSEDYDGNIDNHYFKVEIRGYQEAIEDLFKSNDFVDRLCILLPLRYSPEFTKQKEIKNKYQEFMGQSLDIFSCSVKFNSTELFKPYTDKHILKSEIVFWELKFPSKGENVAGENIGILWFSFNRIIKALPKNEPYGILVRSKNMLMGDRYSLANDANRSKTDYITTLRELSQALNGVRGEMLINFKNLKDNARRDWFKVDEESIKLRHIIVEFMRRLHTYRYAASTHFGVKKREKSEERLIEAYKGLITNYDPDKFIPDIDKLKKEIEASKEIFEFADDDIPTFPHTVKRFYERLIAGLYKYFSDKGKRAEFINIRKFIKEYLNERTKRLNGKNITS